MPCSILMPRHVSSVLGDISISTPSPLHRGAWSQVNGQSGLRHENAGAGSSVSCTSLTNARSEPGRPGNSFRRRTEGFLVGPFHLDGYEVAVAALVRRAAAASSCCGSGEVEGVVDAPGSLDGVFALPTDSGVRRCRW